MRIIGIECNFLKVSKNFFPPLLYTANDPHRFRNSPSFPISCIWQCLIVWFPSSSSLVHCVYLLYSGGRVFDLWTPPVTHSSRSARSMSGRQPVNVPRVWLYKQTLYLKWKITQCRQLCTKSSTRTRLKGLRHRTADWWLNQELKRGGGFPFPCCHCSILMLPLWLFSFICNALGIRLTFYLLEGGVCSEGRVPSLFR